MPFCDYRIAEYLYRVPWEMKDRAGFEKGMLRHAMEGWLPAQVLWRKKSPYPKTHDPAYLALMRRRLDRLLADKSAPLWELIRPERAWCMAGEELSQPWYGQLMMRPQTIAYFCQITIGCGTTAWIFSFESLGGGSCSRRYAVSCPNSCKSV